MLLQDFHFPPHGPGRQLSFTSGCISTDGRLTMVQVQRSSCVRRLERGLDGWIKTPSHVIGIDTARFGLNGRIRVELASLTANDALLVLWQKSLLVLAATAITNPSGHNGLAALGRFAQRFGLSQEAFLACVRVLRHASIELPVLLTVSNDDVYRRLSQVDRYWRLTEAVIATTGFNFRTASCGDDAMTPATVADQHTSSFFANRRRVQYGAR